MKGGIFVLGLAFFQLGAPQDPEKALAEFRYAYRNKSKAVRAAAVFTLARTPHLTTLRALAPLLSSDAKEVRIAAAKGLGGFTEYRRQAAPILLGALKGPNAKQLDVQVAIYQALGRLKDESTLEAIHRGFKDKYAKVAKAAIAAAGDIRHITSLDRLIDLMNKTTTWIKRKQGGGYRDDKGQQGDNNAKTRRVQSIQKEIITSIQKITKEKWTTALEWNIWYARRRAKFKVPD